MASKFSAMLEDIEMSIISFADLVETPRWAILVNGDEHWTKDHVNGRETIHTVFKKCWSILKGKEDFSEYISVDAIELYFIHVDGSASHVYTLKEEEDEIEQEPKTIKIKISNKQRLKINKMLTKYKSKKTNLTK